MRSRPFSAQAILEIALERLRADIIARSQQQGQQASGRTYAALDVRNVAPLHGELWGPTYLPVLEDGRRPGRVPKDFAVIIMEWAEYKGIVIPDPVEFERWAQAVAWNIRRSGTLLYRSGRKLDIFQSVVADFERYLTEQMKAYYTMTVTNTIRTAWQNINNK